MPEHYVCRIHDEGCFDVLTNLHQASIDEGWADEYLTEQSILEQKKRARTKEEKRGADAFLRFIRTPPGSVILLMATSHWKSSNVSGSTLIGIGVVEAPGYTFGDTQYWRHRLPLGNLALCLTDDGHPYRSLASFGVEDAAARDRYVRDGKQRIPKLMSELQGSVRGFQFFQGFSHDNGSAALSEATIPTLIPAPKARPAAKGPTVFTGSHQDFHTKAHVSAAIGARGEEIVVNFERHRLRAAGYPSLAADVHRASVLKGDGLGYDVLSYYPDGREKYIEVKSTSKANKAEPFYMSARELEYARQMQGRGYHLYRVLDVYNPEPLLFILDDIEGFSMEPTQYVVKGW